MATHVTTGSAPRARMHLHAHAPSSLSVRVAAVAGLVFFVLIIVHSQMRTGAPMATDSGREVFNWFSGLFRALRKAESGSPALAIAALGGAALAAASTVFGALVESTVANRYLELGASGSRVWWTLFLFSSGATLLGLVVMIGATAVVSLRSGLFAQWFGIASALLALLSVVGAFTVRYGSTAIQTIAGVAVLLDSVWILLVAWFLWRDPGRAL